MPTASPGIEGALELRLVVAGGRVDGVRVSSSRPLGAARLLTGKTVDQVLTMVPLLYGICATAQSAAAVQAVEQALGRPAARRCRQAREMLVLVETAREHLVRVLMGWSQWLGEPPPVDALRAVGRLKPAWTAALYPHADGFLVGGVAPTLETGHLQGMIDALSVLIARDVLGMDGAAWLELRDADALLRWADAGATVAARLLRRILAQGQAALGRSVIGILDAVDPAELALRLDQPDADRFVAAPTRCGEPRETGALARQGDTPLLRSLAQRYGNGLLTRQAARLSEMARLPGMLQALLNAMTSAPMPLDAGLTACGADRAGDQRGIGIVDAARGTLVHRVALDGDRIRGYRILAPTEWNFHPDGALVRGLCGLDTGGDLAASVRLLVDAIDPCVGYQLEIVAPET